MDYIHFFINIRLLLAVIIPMSLMILLIVSCRDDMVVPDVPVVVTGEVSEIDNTGATFHGRIINPGSSAITEMGFLWENDEYPDNNSSHKVVPYEKGMTAFSARVPNDLQAGVGYTVKAYLKSGEKITLGNKVTFTSLGSMPPEITDFSPKSGLRNTEVTIRGKNFSYVPSHIQVKFGEIVVPVTASTDSTITIKIPQNVYISENVKITVSIFGKSTVSLESFELGGVFIESIFPLTTSCSGTVKLKGKGFRLGTSTYVRFMNKNYVNDVEWANILSLTDTSMTVNVPARRTEVQDIYTIHVQTGGYSAYSSEEFRISNPQISGISKAVLQPYDTLVISGQFFGELAYAIIGEYRMRIIQQNENEVTVIYEPVLAEGDYKLELINECWHNAVYSGKVSVKSPWVVMENIPVPPRTNGISIALGDKLYVGLGTVGNTYDKERLIDFWEYNTVTEQWTRKADFPGWPREAQYYCLHKGKILIGPGYPAHPVEPPDFWQYDPATNSWEKFTEFHLQPRTRGHLYSITNTLYYGMAYSDDIKIDPDFYWYNEIDDSWNYYQRFNFSFSAAREQFGFTYQDQGIFIDGGSHAWPPNGIYRLNPITGGWKSEGYTDLKVINVFHDENTILFVSPYSQNHSFQELYSVVPYTWDLKKVLPSFEMQGSRDRYFSAIVNDRLYIGLGSGPNGLYTDIIYLDLNDYK